MTNAHTGGDLYGSIGTKRAGVFSYHMYAGTLPSIHAIIRGGIQPTTNMLILRTGFNF